jgi:hypothetical protein
VPGIVMLRRLADALGVTTADLLAGDSDRERLFAELRDAPPALIRRLRAQVPPAGG